MHQINRAVGFQKIAPCTPALMRFTADQQHPQAVTHAVHLDQGGVVAIGQFAGRFGQGKADDVAPAMGQGHGQIKVLTDRHTKRLRFLTINRDIKLRQPAIRGGCAHIINPQGQRDRFADDRKGRGVAHGQAAIPIGFFACHQQMHRRGQIDRQVSIMNPPVADCQYACNPRAGLLGQGIA